MFSLLKKINNLRKIWKYRIFIYWANYYYSQKIKMRNADELLDYKKILSETLKTKTCHPVFSYGNSFAINKIIYGDHFHKIDGLNEHGFHPNDLIVENEIFANPFKKLYTFGSYREKYLTKYAQERNSDVDVKGIGPYILGALEIYDTEDLQRLKQQLGKTLLVFPSHSIDKTQHVKEFDLAGLITEIKRIKELGKFDSVLISVYYIDLELGKAKEYEDAGFLVVTSGARTDINFLSRQKAYIELADCTMSNFFGTYIGYSIALNRPHYFYHQHVVNIKDKKNADLNVKPKAIPLEIYEISRYKLNDEFSALFNEFSEIISEKQLRVTKEYFGNF